MQTKINICFLVLLGTATTQAAVPLATLHSIDFVKDVRPIFQVACVKCHGPLRQEGEYRLDVRDNALKGGSNHAPSIVPFDSAASPLIQFVSGEIDGMQMPAKGSRLSNDQIRILRAWIDEGAEWPDSANENPEDQRSWWSLQPLQNQTPVNREDSQHPIDAFVREKLDGIGLHPAPAADRRVLIRRLFYDLIGVPPEPGEIAEFVASNQPQAYEMLVDRLLASPRYGERWARHWMDTAHFAETHGHDQDRIREHAWPYRDYLIDAFNQDKPYNQFVCEQVAADVLSQGDPRAIAALGFLAAGPWDESSLRDIREDTLDREIGRYLDRDDMLTNVMTNFTSLTVQCARCHDHKFDPIPQADYYALQAVFAGVERANRSYDSELSVEQTRKSLMKRRSELATVDSISKDELLGSKMQQVVLAWESKVVDKSIASPPIEMETILSIAAKFRTEEQRLALALFVERERVTLELTTLPKQSFVYAAAAEFEPDGGLKPPPGPRPIYRLERGDIRNPKEELAPGSLTCIASLPSRFAIESKAESLRRAALAEWIVHKENPLTWRSIVNRVWLLHFGRGLVDTPNDFGRLGSKPSHAELLDWLSVRFRDSGQSLKTLHRLIVTSDTYRQSSSSKESLPSVADAASIRTDAAINIDSDNRLLWRMHRTRLDAECIRDAMLMISGQLDLRMGGPSDRQFDLKPGRHVTPIIDYGQFNLDGQSASRRSVYRFLFRTLPDPFMESLDCPAGDQIMPTRINSVTVQQALSMWNDSLVLRHAEHFAKRLTNEASNTTARVEYAFQLSLGRAPKAVELDRFVQYAEKHGLANFCRLLYNMSEFIFID